MKCSCLIKSTVALNSIWSSPQLGEFDVGQFSHEKDRFREGVPGMEEGEEKRPESGFGLEVGFDDDF